MSIRIAMAQMNLTVGDVAGNADAILATARRARSELNCDCVVYPELSLTGYPPEDLLLRPGFIDQVEAQLGRLCAELTDVAVILGYPQRAGGDLYNAAGLIARGRLQTVYRKRHLPNYSVFDEKRYFVSGGEPCVATVAGTRIGITICEDVWRSGPISDSVSAGAQLIVNLNASPFHMDRARERFEMVAQRARENGVPIVYVNLVGGQDELVFDGASFVVDGTGRLTQRSAHFAETVDLVELDTTTGVIPQPAPVADEDPLEKSVYDALVTGVRDYVEKNGFAGVVVGLSGGIDSALTLAIAADALGAERVEAVLMPSRYTAKMSVEDARSEAEALGVAYHVVPIEPMFECFLEQLAPLFADRPEDETEQNIQARCRGVLLMALSNKFGKIVLTTGNKSEMAVGYATLYGDMAGGFAAIKDVSKTLVYRLARYRNGLGPVIPSRVLERPPSAELAPDQRDEDSLPPYDVLDAILEAYVEQDLSPTEIVALGHDPQVVQQVIGLVNRNEYKRRQAAPGVRITQRAFGRDRRYPITSGFRPVFD